MTHRKKILIYDDQDTVINSVKKMLNNLFSVTGVTEEREMWKKLHLEHWDLLLLDLSLDGTKAGPMEGIQLITHIREACKNLKIVIYTYDDKLNTLKKAFEEGAFDYFVKSANPDDLPKYLDGLLCGPKTILNRPLKIFIGYSEKDKDIKETLRSHIWTLHIPGELELRLWDKDDIIGGENEIKRIREELMDAQLIVALLSVEMFREVNKQKFDLIEECVKQKKLTIPVMAGPMILNGLWKELKKLPVKHEGHLKDAPEDEYFKVAVEIRRTIQAKFETKHLHICGACPHKN